MGKLSTCSFALSGLLLFCAAGSAQDEVQGVTTTLPASANAVNPEVSSSVSQVRIVRLSEIRGKVEMERAASQGFQATFPNLPVVQGSRLKSDTGVAEVEFEDNSTLRIAPASSIEFAELGRNSLGATTNKVRLVSGTLYVSLVSSKTTDFQVKVGDQTVTLTPSTHLRLDLYPAGSELTVFKGKAIVTTGAAETLVSSGKVLKLGAAENTHVASARNEEPGLYDEWDKQQKERHDTRVATLASASPYTYGLGDLNYYGNFIDAGGCGQMWQPYFASAAWDPYASGLWAYYPNAGYSWVSPYPWGWTPFHSGSWINCPGTGWGWQPGGNWNGLRNVTLLKTINHRPFPPHAPAPGQTGLVPVGLATLTSSRMTAGGNKFEFAKDSAGLGVPRNLGVNLRKSSQTVLMRGSAQTRVEYMDALQPAMHTAATNAAGVHSSNGRAFATSPPTSR